MRFYSSADRHGVAHQDALWVIDHARVIVELREDPPKMLYIGFDSVGRALEVVTDESSIDGEVVVIHADNLTTKYYELLEG